MHNITLSVAVNLTFERLKSGEEEAKLTHQIFVEANIHIWIYLYIEIAFFAITLNTFMRNIVEQFYLMCYRDV